MDKLPLSEAKKLVIKGEWYKLVDFTGNAKDFDDPEDRQKYLIGLLEKRKKRLGSRRWRIKHLYKIVNKDGKLVVFKPNDEQWKLFDKYEEKNSIGEGARIRILKGRQFGITTFHCIYYLDDVIWTPGRTNAIIAHEKEPLTRIFETVKRAYEKICLPENMKPKADTDNIRELSFNVTSSKIYVALKVRSGTVHKLHVSERAFIVDPVELKTGSYQAVPANGMITEETTAKGRGEFYKAWSKGLGWENIFLSWKDHKEYSVKKRPNFWFPEHEDYLNEHGLTEEQKNWWMVKFAEIDIDENSLISGIDLMKQEYPLTPEEAFVANSNTVFTNYQWIQEKQFRRIDLLSLKSDYPIIAPKSNLIMWRERIPGVGYSIGADVAEGLSKGDNSCAYVINNEELRVEAVWHGKIEPEAFAQVLFLLGKYYNEAWLGIERNNHGLTVIDNIKRDYPNLYRQRVHDRLIDGLTEKLGWTTSAKTKPLMIDDLKYLIRKEELVIYDTEIIKEFSDYVADDSGRTNALPGSNDDRIMALAIAYQVYKKHPHNPRQTTGVMTLEQHAMALERKSRENLG